MDEEKKEENGKSLGERERDEEFVYEKRRSLFLARGRREEKEEEGEWERERARVIFICFLNYNFD